MTAVLVNPTIVLSAQAHRFDVAPEVKDLERKLSNRARTSNQRFALVFMWTVIPVFALLYWRIAAVVLPQSQPLDAAITVVFLVAFLAAGIAFSIYLMRKSATPEVDAINNERREERASIDLSRETAKSLGKDAVPALTKEHAEAGIRFDKKMYRYRAKWNRDDFYGIRSLLIEDLSREDAIINIVTQRGMTTAIQVTEALNEMESNGKPLQCGWL
jgi:hypothetical protein